MLVSVLCLISFLFFVKRRALISGVDYPLYELFLVVFPMLLLSLMLQDSLTLLYASSNATDASLILKVIGAQ